MDKNSFTIHIPATTANLGPGFDCLGLALDLWNTVTFSQVDGPFRLSIEGEGKNTLPEDETNLIFQSANRLANAYRKSLPENLHIICQNNIPIASGLGSSASAVVCGLVGAKIILNIDISSHELLQTAAQIEGHADNAAACFFGGLILVRSEIDALHVIHRDIQPITAVVAAAELMQIFHDGNYESLKETMKDKLHQAYRLPLLPGAEHAMQTALIAGAYGSSLSGAGPSVIAFTTKNFAQTVGDAMQSAYQQAYISSRIFTLACPARGYFIT